MAIKDRIKRYLAYNVARIRQAERFDAAKAAFLFRIVPFLLHHNHERLPGYVAGGPGGIHRFAPERLVGPALLARYCPDAPPPDTLPAVQAPAIQAVLTIGSVGTIAQSAKSDCDYWLAVDSSQLDLDALRRRCRLLETWARDQGHEIHFFPMDIGETRENRFTATVEGESAGSALQRLLKEELYRSHVLVAGKMPLWWLSPPGKDETAYRQTIGRLLRRTPALTGSCLDLGALGDLPRQEIFGACLWQLNKAMDSPFKSVIKFAYLELLLERARFQDLSDRLKALVTFPEALADLGQKPLPVAEIDPYLLLAAAIVGHYRARGDREQEDLIRTCLFLKTREGVTSLEAEDPASRKALLQRMARHHLLPADYTELLTIQHRPFRDLVRLGIRVHDFLGGTYSRLRDEAPEMVAGDAAITERDLAILGRRLFVFYQHQPDKVPFLKVVAPELVRQEAVFITGLRRPEGVQAVAFQGDGGADPDRLIYRAPHPVDLLAWLHVNGVMDQGTRCHLDRTPLPLTQGDLDGITAALRRHLPRHPLAEISGSDLLAEPRITAALVVVNLERRPVRGQEQVPSAVICRNSHGAYFVHHHATLAQLKRAVHELLTRHYVSRWNDNLHYFLPEQPERHHLAERLGL